MRNDSPPRDADSKKSPQETTPAVSTTVNKVTSDVKSEIVEESVSKQVPAAQAENQQQHLNTSKVSASSSTTIKAETENLESSSKPAAKIASVPKVSITEVLASKHLNDASKFHVFTELVQDGQMSNKEVVNSILYLVRSFLTIFPHLVFSLCIGLLLG